jgi:Kef-type K+ transport system membrane component KefB
MNSGPVLALLLALTVILVVAALFGAIARGIGQPPVVGEIFAGIMLGPTLLHGAVADTVLPVDIRPLLGALADVGLALFMFLVGMEIERRTIHSRPGALVSISLVSIALPFGLGTLLAQGLLGHQPPGQHVAFTLFIGTAVAVTALPVLAGILTDFGLTRTPTGQLAVASAAIADVLAWALLAIVVGLVRGVDQPSWRLALLPPYIALLLLAGQPVLLRILRSRRADGRRLAIVLAGLLASSTLTECMGSDYIIGAFLFGAAMPRLGAEAIRTDITRSLEQICRVLLLPVFFAVAGLQVNLSHVSVDGLGELALIMFVAVGGKFAGVFVTARLHGIPARHAGALGAMLNTRGLTELVFLTVGLNLGLLDTALYSLMVVMALLTTAMTGPLLRLIYPPHYAHTPEFLPTTAKQHSSFETEHTHAYP